MIWIIFPRLFSDFLFLQLIFYYFCKSTLNLIVLIVIRSATLDFCGLFVAPCITLALDVRR